MQEEVMVAFWPRGGELCQLGSQVSTALPGLWAGLPGSFQTKASWEWDSRAGGGLGSGIVSRLWMRGHSRPPAPRHPRPVLLHLRLVT